VSRRRKLHESVFEIPALLEARRQELARMTPAERQAEKERDRKGPRDRESPRASCVGLLDRLRALAASTVHRSDFETLLPEGILAELDEALAAARARLDQLEKPTAGASRSGAA
jgi:hypothetical protein